MVRNVAKATGLPAGTEIVVADFGKPQTLPRILEGVDKVYLTSAPDPEQVTLHRNFIHAAAKAGVRHIVRHSVRGADENSPIKIARWHAASQGELERSGVAWTHLQPVFNMQNLLRFASSIRSQGAFHAPMRDGAMSMVDARDVASVAVEALTAAGGHEGHTYLVTGPEPLSFADAAHQLSAVLERPIRYVDVSPEQARNGMLGAGMPQWYVEDMLGFYAFYATGAAYRRTARSQFSPVCRGLSGDLRSQRIAGKGIADDPDTGPDTKLGNARGSIPRSLLLRTDEVI
jgi:uncharacterized protein YbjT (DUF2867 family)